MSQRINQILKQALNTFKNTDKSLLNANLEKLKILVNGLTASDVGLKDQNNQPSKLIQSPASCIDIYECESFIALIFIIHKGMSIPLHDHPGMFGLCKVLYGNIKITSYDHLLVNGDAVQKQQSRKGVNVRRQPPVLLTENDNCSLLTPHVGNFHAIHSIGGDAAMFDILAPPYSENNGKYYREINITGTEGPEESETYLAEVPEPMDFFCTSLPYSGPKIVPP